MYSNKGSSHMHGAQQVSWQQTQQWAQPHPQKHAAHSNSMQQSHSYSSQATPANMNYDSSYIFDPRSHRPAQQRAAPAAAGGSSYNYGFGQPAPGPTVPLMPSASHASSISTQPWSFAGGASSQWQNEPPSTYADPEQAAAVPGYPGAEPDSLKSVKDLPAVFQPIFGFRYFNPVQSECFDVACLSDTNMVVSAPTGAGKTGVMELAMLRLLSKHLAGPAGQAAAGMGDRSRTQLQFKPMNGSHKIIYLGPIKALVQERQMDWQARFGQALGLKVIQLTGDDDSLSLDDLESADIICSTPEKFDQVTRRVVEKGAMGVIAEMGLVLLDEVHLLNESGRGSSLEAGCVCRIKALAAFPEMAKSPLGSVRFVAVSATIPNIGDIARWLSVPPTGLRQYGDELRPCKLTTHVKGYAPAKNDFLFERRLNEYVYTIIKEYSKGRPALVFCSSRKGTVDAASTIVKEAEAHAQVAAYTGPAAGSTGSSFVRDMQQLQRLRAAAVNTQAKALASVLVAGVGFHNAAMEPSDRAIVEELFKANDLAVLCTTGTLAMGVNLPAHLVVLKGTVRWVGDTDVLPGEQPGYKEYSQTEVLQMVGRAGRPQFDAEGVAVIMTSRDSTSRYQKLLAGQVVESCLLSMLPEHLNAEIMLGTVKDVSQAIAWIRSTFLFTRVRANPQHYGLKLKPGATEAELDNLLREQIVLQPVKELMKYQLVASDEDNYSLTSTPAGKLMAANYLKLKTMAAIVQLGERPNLPSLLRVICSAEEFKNTSLRRSEKKVLNEINHSKDPEQLRYHVMASKEGNKIKDRISLPAEKLFILLNDALADKPSEQLDYSLKQEQSRLMVVGQRIAKCMAKYYALRGSFSSAGRSLLLSRSFKTRLWEDSKCSVRQLPAVGRQMGVRLAAAGLGSLQAVGACADAHRLEVTAQKPYPWGSELLAALRAVTPPAINISMQVLGTLPGGRGYSCQVTLTRGAAGAAAGIAYGSSTAQQPGAAGGGSSNAWAGMQQAAPGAEPESSSGRGSTPCKLLVGCSSTDGLLLLRVLVLETFQSPMQVQFKVPVPAGFNQPLNVSTMLLHEKFIGFDQKASMTLPALRQQQHTRQTPGDHANSWQYTAGSSAADDSMVAEEAADAHTAAFEDMQQHSCEEVQAAPAQGDALLGYEALKHKQQMRNKRARQAAADVQLGSSAGHSSDAAAAGADDAVAGQDHDGMPPPAKRTARNSRPDRSGLQQQLASELPQQQPLAANAYDSMEHAAMGRLSVPHPGMLGHSAASLASGSSDDQPGPPPVQSLIAACYKSMFSLRAAGAVSSTQHTSASDCSIAAGDGSSDGACRSAATMDLQASGAAGAPMAQAVTGSGPNAAVDAGELQVTPASSDKTPWPLRPGSQHPQHAAAAAADADYTHSPQHDHASTLLQHEQQLQVPGVSARAAGCESPVHLVGQAMSSLFDMLADDEDADQQGLAQGQGHDSTKHQQQHTAAQAWSRHLPSASSAAAAFNNLGRMQPDTGTCSTHVLQQPKQKQQQQQHRQQPLLAELHVDTVAPGGGYTQQSLPTSASSASTVLGAAVHKSHQATRSLMSSLQSHSRQLHSVERGISCHAVPEYEQTAAAAVASKLGVLGSSQARQQQLPAHDVSSTTAQPLLTPPHQIRPVFTKPVAAGAAASNNGSAASSRVAQQSRREVAARWSAGNAAGPGRAGGQQPRVKELPDFSQFAFSTGTGATAASGSQAAAFKPSANAGLFGHLPAVQPRGHAQGKLLIRPVSALRSAGHSATTSTSNWSSQLQGQAAAGRFRLQGSGYCGAVDAGAGASEYGGGANDVSQVSLPGAVSWQSFVSNHDAAAAGSTADAATKGFLHSAGRNTSHEVLRQPEMYAAGYVGSAQRPASSAALDLPAPAVVPPQQVAGDTAQIGDDGLDLGDIFAFMR